MVTSAGAEGKPARCSGGESCVLTLESPLIAGTCPVHHKVSLTPVSGTVLQVKQTLSSGQVRGTW
jgi:hypothetical protein